jgi:hypothetical protein
MKDIVTQLRTNSECLAPSIMLEAADTIERLREERDDARREVCEWVEMDEATSARVEAELRGWNCFKKDGK